MKEAAATERKTTPRHRTDDRVQPAATDVHTTDGALQCEGVFHLYSLSREPPPARALSSMLLLADCDDTASETKRTKDRRDREETPNTEMETAEPPVLNLTVANRRTDSTSTTFKTRDVEGCSTPQVLPLTATHAHTPRPSHTTRARTHTAPPAPSPLLHDVEFAASGPPVLPGGSVSRTPTHIDFRHRTLLSEVSPQLEMTSILIMNCDNKW